MQYNTRILFDWLPQKNFWNKRKASHENQILLGNLIKADYTSIDTFFGGATKKWFHLIISSYFHSILNIGITYSYFSTMYYTYFCLFDLETSECLCFFQSKRISQWNRNDRLHFRNIVGNGTENWNLDSILNAPKLFVYRILFIFKFHSHKKYGLYAQRTNTEHQIRLFEMCKHANAFIS